MKIPHVKFRTVIYLCFTVLPAFITLQLQAADSVLSDPDHISTGAGFTGTENIKLGDTFETGSLRFSGMAEIRNEERFNQGILPNHNWRGFVSILYDRPLLNTGDLVTLTCGLEHESAHPTMGLNDGNDSAFEKIYDGTYRNINLNSFLLRCSTVSGSGCTIRLTGDVQFYCFSRNTPELPVNDLTWSEGFSAGFEARYPAGDNTTLFISGFDRYIFQGRKKTSGNIYYDTSSGAVTRLEKYPVINDINTVSARAGLIFSGLISERQVSVYCGILYGNIFGFTDSREKRTVYSLGIEVLR